MLNQRWPSVVNDGPTLIQYWVNVSCLLGLLSHHCLRTPVTPPGHFTAVQSQKAVGLSAKHTGAKHTGQHDVPRDIALVYKDTILIISKTYQRDGVGERYGQLDNYQNCYIFVARRAGCRNLQLELATEENASHFALVVTLVCGQSRDFRVCRRVKLRVNNRVRVGVFCSLLLN